METRLVPSGLPTLETLVYVPVGLFATVAAADLLVLVTGNAALAEIAAGLLAAGIVCAVIAACCLLPAVPVTASASASASASTGSGPHPHRLPLAWAALLLVLFVASWLLRQFDGAAGGLAPALSAIGLAGTVLLVRTTTWASQPVEVVSG